MHNLTQINQEHLVFIKLLIAHFVADFVLQTDKMVKNKKWLSKEMLQHIGVVYITAALFSFLWWQSILIALFHYTIDGLKIELSRKYKKEETYLFLGDQFAHIITLVGVCAFQFDWLNNLTKEIHQLFQVKSYILILLGYLIVTFPVGYLIGLSTRKMNQIKEEAENDFQADDKNGMKIGIFERIIILTFVLLGQFEAIGFLITGKSLLRFATRNEHKKSEYVLLGTMMSYAITIGVGVMLNKLFS